MDIEFIVSGFVVGVLVGLTGVGGGALMTPLLIFGFGIPSIVAVGTDLIFAAITKANGVLVHARQGSVDWLIVRRLASGSLPAALVTLVFLGQIDIHAEQVQRFITVILGLALIFTGITLIWQRPKQGRANNIRQVKTNQAKRQPQVLVTVVTGVVLGVLVTLSSVGAGALGAAVLFWLYPKLSAARVVGTDLAHAVPLTALAGLGHWHLGAVDVVLLGTLLIGSLPGIILGSRFSAKLPEAWLRSGIALLLFFIGVRLIS